jgi:hypothetical protein
MSSFRVGGWVEVDERRNPETGRNVQAEVLRESPLARTFRTLRTAPHELLQLFDQLLDALQRTRLVIRHPNLSKALSAPWVS